MFLRCLQDGRIVPVQLENLWEGQSLFIIAGSPTIKALPLGLLQQRGIITMGINNASEVVKTNLWVANDQPACFYEPVTEKSRILQDASIMKFVNYGKREFQYKGKPWKYLSNLFFFGVNENYFNANNFCNPHRDILWWKNTFFTALQLAWRLGFKKIYLVGAEFKISETNQYAWESKLSKEEIQKNNNLYNQTIQTMKNLKSTFEKNNFKIFNTCLTSSLINDWGYTDFEVAIKEALDDFPEKIDTTLLPHASKFAENKGAGK